MMATDSADRGGDYTLALSELHRLLLDYQSAEHFLRKAASLTARTVGSGLSCSIMTQSSGHMLMVATSDALATFAHAAQDELGQGPSLRCLRWQHPVQIGDLADDTRWPLFARHAAETGIRSCVCVPLQVPGMTGALSLWAAAPHAFGAQQPRSVTTFARYLGDALAIGARQDGFLATVDQLRTALASRAVIDQATGVILGRQCCTSSEALAMLQAMARNRNLELRDLARQIIEEASTGPPRRSPAGESQTVSQQ